MEGNLLYFALGFAGIFVLAVIVKVKEKSNTIETKRSKSKKIQADKAPRFQVPADQNTIYSEEVLLGKVSLLIEQSKNIEAIKLLREQKGIGLKEAKEAVDAMAMGRTVDLSLLRPQTQESAASLNNANTSDSAQYMEEVKALVRQGKKIDAIKILRENSGLGLKEAKDLVDNIR